MASRTPPAAKFLRHAASLSRCHSSSALHALTQDRFLHALTQDRHGSQMSMQLLGLLKRACNDDMESASHDELARYAAKGWPSMNYLAVGHVLA